MKDFTRYLRAMGAIHQRFTREEELELADRKDWGDVEARDLLVASCLPMVVSIAGMLTRAHLGGKVTRQWFDYFQDVVQGGNLGLVRGVMTFNPRRYHTRFSTHAWRWIRQGIRHVLEKEPPSCAACSLDQLGLDVEAPIDYALSAEKEEYYDTCCDYVEELLKVLPYRTAYVLRRKFTRGRHNSLKAIGKILEPPLSKEGVRQIINGGKKQLVGYHRRQREECRAKTHDLFPSPRLMKNEDFLDMLNNLTLSEPEPPWPAPKMTEEELEAYRQRVQGLRCPLRDRKRKAVRSDVGTASH